MVTSAQKLVFIIEDDAMMAECIERAIKVDSAHEHIFQIKTFPDAISAMAAIADCLPDLILLDILLSGPNGFTLLNELATYQDTANIPIVVISSLDFSLEALKPYGVCRILNKETMKPREIQTIVQELI